MKEAVKKKAIVSVINDLVTDQRVDRSCSILQEMGFDVSLVGRKLPNSLPMNPRPYQHERMRLIFRQGPLFYAEYNLRLFFFLLFHPCDLLLSNDLDTLLANYLIHKVSRRAMVYDSHEYFTGVPELQDRPIPRGVWISIERWIFPRLQHVITVNDSIAALYEKAYGVRPEVVRNIPPYREKLPRDGRAALGLPGNKPLLLMQGSGINVSRGAEEAVLAMRYLPEACLLIIGGGDVLPVLHGIVKENALEDRVVFLPKMPYKELCAYTAAADIGLSLDKGDNINYRNSLPNKLFDYIQARIPVLASGLPEVKRIIEDYEIGEIIERHDPEHIAIKARGMFSSPEKMEFWQEKLNIAARELCWENEAAILRDVFRPFA